LSMEALVGRGVVGFFPKPASPATDTQVAT
jgi:hypothetical protein